MQPTSVAPPQQHGGPGVPGASRESKRYYDEQGRFRTSREPVPIDQYGRIAGAKFSCRRCRTSRWYAAGLKGIPTCERCDRRMEQVRLQAPPLLPWRELWDVAERPLRPVWALPAMAAAGYAVDAAAIPALALVVAAPVVGELARRFVEAQKVRMQVAAGRLEEDDPGGDKRRRAAIARQARLVGYGAAAGMGWLSLVAALGVDPSTFAGQVALAVAGGVGVALWLAPAATWWRRDRAARNRPVPVSAVGPVQEEGGETVAPADPDEVQTRRVWQATVGSRQVAEKSPAGQVITKRGGKLSGSWLEDWHRIQGGWAATIVSSPGVYTSESFLGARSAIASAFRMKVGMITIIPDADDESQALVLAQRTSPIVDKVAWSGPSSIAVERGVAPVARYLDGGTVLYEIYRPGWGVPHVGAFGTTGSGKSEFINQLFAIDRWAHYVDGHGVAHGIVADFLIDPQQGQSFAPFLDDLAAPVAASIDEAMLLVEALTEEMLRRNRYLAREAKTWDAKRNKWRTGRKWWNPLVDGPILALTIDEAHDYLSHKPFATLVTKAGRMWRKCGGQLRIATHTPLLTDLGGSMALRDMLTGGFVFMGRTANSLSGPTAFNGRLPVDPRTIPAVPGMAYILTGLEPKPMLARAMFEEDYYDWVRDADDNPIGYPAVLPAETVKAFGREYATWVAASACGESWVAEVSSTPAQQDSSATAVDAVRSVLLAASASMDMDEIDAALRRAGTPFATRTVRDALGKLRGLGEVHSGDGRHQVSEALREQFAEVGV